MNTNEPDTSHEQLVLLAVDSTAVQFRLDQRTRERGLAHVAALKALLAARAASRVQPQPARRQAA